MMLMITMIPQQVIETSWLQVSQAYTNMFVRLINFTPELMGAIFVLLFTALMARFVRRTIRIAMERTKADQNIRFLVGRSGSIFVWLIGVSAMLSVLNINMAVVFASLGVTGAAIGFAISDVIANFVAGVVLLSIRPFKLGDTITIDIHEGTVERIEIRTTVLKTAEGKEVSIPNAKVFSSVIIKHTPFSMRRLAFNISINDENSFEEVRELLLSTIQSVPGVSATTPPEVSLTTFAANSLNLDIRCWIDETASFSAVASQVKLQVRETLHQRDISIAPAAAMTLLRLPAARRREAANGKQQQAVNDKL